MLALLALMAPGAARAADTWQQYSNSHFQAVSNAAAPEVLALLGDLERFRATVQIMTSVHLPVDAPADIVIVFRNRGEYRDYAPGFNVVGHVVKGDGSRPSVILMPIEQAQLGSLQVVRHEFVHTLLVHHPIRFPRWYEEGLAEFLSTARFENDSVVIGLPPKDRMEQRYELLPFDEILSEEYNPHKRTVRFGDPYLQYWLLVNYLLLVNAERRDDLEDYLRLVHLRTPSLEAFRIAFGVTPEQFWDVELKSFAMNLRTRGKVLSRRLPAPDLDLEFRTEPVLEEDVRRLLEQLRPES